MKWVVERARFDEVFQQPGRPRRHYKGLLSTLQGFTSGEVESGYLHVRGKRHEPAQSHAWVEPYSPSHGWVPFDPTQHREIDDRYVTVAHGRDYDDVPPNKGIYRGNAKETLRTEVFTRPSTQKGISTLQEEIQLIDLPVFQEIPERRVERPITPIEEVASQQQ